MNRSGLNKLSFFENKHIRFVSVGEYHECYNVTEPNVIHKWLDADQLKNALLIVEDLFLDVDTSVKSVLPRYFSRDNIFSANDVRDESIFIGAYSLKDNNFRAIVDENLEFIQSFSPVLATYNMEDLRKKYVLDPTRVYSKYLYDKKNATFGFIDFIEVSFKANNIFNIFGNNQVIKNRVISLVRYCMTQKENFVVPKEYTDIVGYYYVCELMLHMYVKYNFIYRLVDIAYKYTYNERKKHELADTINKFIDASRPVTRYVMAHVNSCVFDFIAILKIVDTYIAYINGKISNKSDKQEHNWDSEDDDDVIDTSTLDDKYTSDKKLIFLSSGGGHNEFIDKFLPMFFELIGDPFITNISFDDSDMKNSKSINSSEFSNFIASNENFGLLNLPSMIKYEAFMTYSTKECILSAFTEIIKRLFPHIRNVKHITNILIKLNLSDIQLLLPYILNETIDKINIADLMSNYDENTLLKMNIIKLKGNANTRVIHDNLCLRNTLIERLTRDDIENIPRYTVYNFMHEAGNVPLADMRNGTDIFSNKSTSPDQAQASAPANPSAQEQAVQPAKETLGGYGGITMNSNHIYLILLSIIIILLLYLFYLLVSSLCPNNNSHRSSSPSIRNSRSCY